MMKLENDSRKIKLTKEFAEKSDKDIETIKSLKKLAEKTGNILVLSGGYATEALCGGKITRAHGDIDANIILTGTKSPEVLFSEVEKILFAENTKWVLKSQKPDKVVFDEDDKSIDYIQLRTVEVRLNEPHENNVKYPLKKLINSKGEDLEVCVVDLEEQVCQKIQKFYSLRGGVDTNTDRHSSVTDYADLKRLLELKELDHNKIKSKFPVEFEYVSNLLANYFSK